MERFCAILPETTRLYGQAVQQARQYPTASGPAVFQEERFPLAADRRQGQRDAGVDRPNHESVENRARCAFVRYQSPLYLVFAFRRVAGLWISAGLLRRRPAD